MNNSSNSKQQANGALQGQSKQNAKDSAHWPDASSSTQAGSNGTSSQQADPSALKSTLPSLPKVSLPTGGGAIKGMGEKFNINTATGTASATIPIKTTTARGGLVPDISLQYDSGQGNGAFGIGWQLSGLTSITRKTSKGIPQYQDGTWGDAHSDVFLLSGAEDLVPRFKIDPEGNITLGPQGSPVIDEISENGYVIRRYSPRIDQTFLRIERWTNTATPEDVHWRVIDPQNCTTIYGSTSNSRIFDPAASPNGPLRIFSWLMAERYDCVGNAVIFTYKAEDSVNVQTTQANEVYRVRTANRYVQTMQYGNMKPNRDADSWIATTAFSLPADTWKFSVVFDYGEYDSKFPTTTDAGSWICRPDPFSDYHSGYEVRTYRLCQRILMFHHFSELGIKDSLAGSMEFSYNLNPTASCLVAAQYYGHSLSSTGNSYTSAALPPVSFTYSLFPSDDELSQLMVQEGDETSLENLPIGLDDSAYKWVDLDGQGLSGVMSEQGRDWYFKGNTSANNIVSTAGDLEQAKLRLGPSQRLTSRPSLSINGSLTFGDVSGAGVLDVIQHDTACWGFFERVPDSYDWNSFQAFYKFPNIDTSMKGTKFVDLTGDGLADILMLDDHIFSLFPSLGVDGYGDAPAVMQYLDSFEGPLCVASDTESNVYIADMSGDGLMDIVRVRNGDVCYWPNLGYGRFGSRVQMDNAPWFDSLDLFNESRIHLADIDGSGTTDIIYISSPNVNIFLNQSGNSFAAGKSIGSFSPIEDTAVVDVIDLLGNGTSCIVWSSSLPLSGQAPLRYLDLMQGVKPHLLTQINNNLGTETSMHYTPSTKFYLDDIEAGKPWLTRLPFPVHCVDQVEIIDRVARNRFVSTYTYHHGYFDGIEREFRGFARVDQRDAEEFATSTDSTFQNLDASWQIPPTITKTWYHTGVFINENSISQHLSSEYFGAPPDITSTTFSSFSQTLLPDTVLPTTLLAIDSLREAYRALKGSMLRQEIYAEDQTAKSDLPYSVQEKNYTIEVVQPLQDSHAHSIYSVHPRESISYHYERNTADPRVEHSMVLQVDSFGNVLKQLQISYGRALGQSSLTGASLVQQQTTLIVYSENDVTNLINDSANYRIPLPFERRRYELSGFAITQGQTRLDFDDFTINNFGLLSSLTLIPSEQQKDPSKKQKRLFNQSRNTYRNDSLSSILAPGLIESLAIPASSYHLCLTLGILNSIYIRKLNGQAPENLIPDPKSLVTGYVDLDNDGSWWQSAGTAFYDTSPSVPSAQELAQARSHFFVPRAFVDPFGNTNMVDYDTYDLKPVKITDPLGNISEAIIDYRVLQPAKATDPNGNSSMVAFDALGAVVGTALMGKQGDNVGDSLTGFEADLTQVQIDAFFAAPKGPIASQLLGNATSRVVYDLTRYWRNESSNVLPSYTATIARETHTSDPIPQGGLKLQVSFAYSDGFNRVVQAKKQVEAGALLDGGPVVNQRWVGSGWTIFDNKANAVRKYEPFFDDTHDFKYNYQFGVSPTAIYDPLSRLVATLYPDHTYKKVVFSPWFTTQYDEGDNVLTLDMKNDVDVGQYFDKFPDANYLPSWYAARNSGQLGAVETANATKAKTFSNTPTTLHYDPMGRTILSVYDNGGSKNLITTNISYDISGRQLDVTDTLNRKVVKYDYDLCGDSSIHQSSMDSGEKWTLTNAVSSPILRWNSRGFRFRNVYDANQRVIEVWTQLVGSNEFLYQKTIWGEGATDASQHNLRGKMYVVQDQAGSSSSIDYDFKGNLLKSTRQFASEYRKDLDWSAAVDLDSSIYQTSLTYDALNRPVITTAADASEQFNVYDDGGHLKQVFVNSQGKNTDGDPSQWSVVLQNVDYNAKDQMAASSYGNGVSRAYVYDPLRFRLTKLTTTRLSGSNPLQALSYVYDPVGNISNIQDNAQQTIYFRNQKVDPTCDYTYDPIYRLITATGREHLGQNDGPYPTQPLGSTPVDQPGDGNAMGTYKESYVYDGVGNILSIAHSGSDATKPGWTCTYNYNETSTLESVKNNRLSSTSIGNTTSLYRYDDSGNINSMPHLSSMQWDCADHLRSTATQKVNGSIPETTYYRYDSSGKRIRKVTDRQSNSSASISTTRMKERLYLENALELYHEFSTDGNTITLGRNDLNVSSMDANCIALIQVRTIGADSGPAMLSRYRVDNHLNSAVVELDDQAAIISYEEYFPYGGTSYRAVNSQVEVPPKRYRFCGRERDEESGMDYGGARYYCPWLGRWASCDPAGFVDGYNLYAYTKLNPVRFGDPGGTDSQDTAKKDTNTPTDADIKAAGEASTQPLSKEAQDRESKPEAANIWGQTFTSNPSLDTSDHKEGFTAAGATGIATGGSGAGQGQPRQYSGNFNLQLELHYEPPTTKHYDFGGYINPSFNGTAGQGSGRAMALGGSFHAAHSFFAKNLDVAVYAQAGYGPTVATDGSKKEGASGQLTFAIGYENLPSKLQSVVLNPILSLAQSGSTTLSPDMPLAATAGLGLGFGIQLDDKNSLTPEVLGWANWSLSERSKGPVGWDGKLGVGYNHAWKSPVSNSTTQSIGAGFWGGFEVGNVPHLGSYTSYQFSLGITFSSQSF